MASRCTVHLGDRPTTRDPRRSRLMGKNKSAIRTPARSGPARATPSALSLLPLDDMLYEKETD